MNERIKQLEIQAFNAVWDLENDSIGPGTHFRPDGFEEKFAELIVGECISVLQNVPNGYSDYRSQIEDADRRYCISHIKEHFGVEDPPVDDVDRILRTVRTRGVQS